MVRLNLSLTRREFCATVAGAITESCEKSTVTIQRADLRHPFFFPSLFLSLLSLPSSFYIPIPGLSAACDERTRAGLEGKGGRGVTHLSITSIALISRRFEPSSDKKAKVQVYICVCICMWLSRSIVSNLFDKYVSILLLQSFWVKEFIV